MSALYPPNYVKLGDGVIGSVVERRPPSHESELAKVRWIQTAPETKQPKSSSSSSTVQDAETSSRLTDATLSANLISQPSNSVKGSSRASATRKRRETPPLSDRALQLRRERGRRNMARYRQRFQDHEASLVASVQLLDEEIKKLEVQSRLVASNVPTNTTCWNIVAEYFRLFRYAFKTPSSELTDHRFPGPTDLDVHRQFVQSAMTSDVLGETGCGVEALLQDYRLVSLYQPDLDNRIVNLENGFEDSIVATTRVNVTISASTLQFAFPHLVNDPVKWDALGKKLLGQKFLLSGSVEFKWDTERHRVVSVQMQADMLTPMLQLLGNLEDVASVFDNAMVTPDCSLVLDDVLYVPADAYHERT